MKAFNLSRVSSIISERKFHAHDKSNIYMPMRMGTHKHIHYQLINRSPFSLTLK